MVKNEGQVGKPSFQVGSQRSVVAAAVLVGILVGILLWIKPFGNTRLGLGVLLQLLFALLPGSIIVTQLAYLASSRRKQYRDALSVDSLGETEVNRLQDLYFGLTPLIFRYGVPAALVTVLCATTIAVLVDPHSYFPWLYKLEPAQQNPVSPAPVLQTTPPAPAQKAATATLDTKAAETSSPSTAYWPSGGWLQVFRGAALGFLGAYIYLLLMLTDRARQRDITTGIATWAAAMPVLGLLMGGVTALIISSAMGETTPSTWTRDAIFFVAGMLPRQFAGFIQSGVQKMFQTGTAPTVRTLPLTTLRGVGADVAARLEEEGIHDVSSLAYASPHQLIRATTYAPRQIVDWIDEALLMATVPENWEDLEKAGVTGALDLAWYQDQPDSINALSSAVKLDASLLKDIVTRLSQDAQVEDLRQLYWDKPTVSKAASSEKGPENRVEDIGPKITTTLLSDGTVGTFYKEPLQAANGVAPLRWTVSPALPATLTLDPISGVISGTPNTVFPKSKFTFTVSDSAAPAAAVTADLMLEIKLSS
jgi:hypothetical protein